MILFSLMGAMLGVSESCYAFIPLCIMLAKAMGYDAIIGFAIVMLANMMGFTAGPMNMYTTGIAQQIAELPLFSGLGVRILVYVILMALSIAYVLWYGARIKKDPTRSLMYTAGAVQEEETIESKYSAEGFTSRKKLTMLVLLLGFCGLIYGIVGRGWWEGSTIGGYLLTKRLFLAKELIAAGTPITEVCYSCGFQNYSTFSRAYKKSFGESPRDYRQSL